MTSTPTRPRYAGFWIRLVAHILDNILLEAVSWLVQFMLMGALYWVMRMRGLESQPLTPLGEQILGVVIFAAIAFVYYVTLHARSGATVGKWSVGVRVVTMPGFQPLTPARAAVRTLAYIVSYLPLACGYLMAAFSPEKRGLHDLIAQTVSIRERVPFWKRVEPLPVVQVAPARAAAAETEPHDADVSPCVPPGT